MKTYIQTLNKITEVMLSSYIGERQGKDKTSFEPLETQIKRWWANIPLSSKDRAFQISEIAGFCRGQYKERPALRDVAAALRSLGWVQKREWVKHGRSRRVWLKDKDKNNSLTSGQSI